MCSLYPSSWAVVNKNRTGKDKPQSLCMRLLFLLNAIFINLELSTF